MCNASTIEFRKTFTNEQQKAVENTVCTHENMYTARDYAKFVT